MAVGKKYAPPIVKTVDIPSGKISHDEIAYDTFIDPVSIDASGLVSAKCLNKLEAPDDGTNKLLVTPDIFTVAGRPDKAIYAAGGCPTEQAELDAVMAAPREGEMMVSRGGHDGAPLWVHTGGMWRPVFSDTGWRKMTNRNPDLSGDLCLRRKGDLVTVGLFNFVIPAGTNGITILFDTLRGMPEGYRYVSPNDGSARQFLVSPFGQLEMHVFSVFFGGLAWIGWLDMNGTMHASLSEDREFNGVIAEYLTEESYPADLGGQPYTP